MSSQPGWHPDPVPPQPGQTAQLRYWDGTRWTEHVAPAQQQPAPQFGQYAGQQAGPYAGQYAAAPPAAYAGGRPPATTPDGVPLAGWWQRVLAYVIDAVVVGLVAGLLAVPWIRDMWETYRDWFRDALDSSSSGAGTVDTAELQRDLFVPLTISLGIQLAVGFAYHVGFLLWRQATPGKLLLGLRVRRRQQPGPLPVGTVLLRWVAQFGPGALGIIPVVGTLTGIYSLLDHLWPLWDDQKQAIHDKVAGTNVVRTR